MKLRNRIVALSIAVAAGLVAYFWWDRREGPELLVNSNLSFERITNSLFTSEPSDPLAAPDVRIVRLPSVRENTAIWGATGRDDNGHIWIGVSLFGAAAAGEEPSARLVEYDPLEDRAVDRGGVLENLSRLGLMKPNDAQVKIHSKIVQAGDGHLYFASMNDVHEEGGPRAPPFGSHLWRIRLPERQWEHLLAAPEGLIAVAGGGDYIYALGYPNHRLVQYHVPTAKVRWTTVGSIDGHISRNVIADARGHVYAPRLRSGGAGLETSLVEFDTRLREKAATPLEHYLSGSPVAAHGIIAFQHMPDRSVYFTTHIGRLYRIATPTGSEPALVSDAGWFHPKGPAYTPCLFTYSGKSTLVGIGRMKSDGPDQWLSRDLDVQLTYATALNLPREGGLSAGNVLLYGCQTRDGFGDFYAVGSVLSGRGQPLVLRMRPAKQPKAEPPP
jgi:hypothetical protein